ncbi:MAG: hypothetical protein AABZ15_07045 [Nitrospirota bacterium]
MNTSIFGLRIKSNEELQPSPADLAAFLASPRASGSPGRHEDDLAAFIQYLELVETYEREQKQGFGQLEFGDRRLLGVLSHTGFFKPAFRVAIEEYKYHNHQLVLLDFNKPEAFIRSAEAEIGKLNPKKRDDQQKIARLQDMIKQRRKDLEVLSKRRRRIAGELYHIAVYVRDNIVLVQRLCEGAVARLAELQVGGKKTGQMIEDLKEQFKAQVREHRQMGSITPEYLESVKAEVAQLSQRLAKSVLEDIYFVTRIYEGFYEHTRNCAGRLEDLLGWADRVRKKDGSDEDLLFSRIEEVLVSLISEFRVNAKPADPPGGSGQHEELLLEKRRELLDHIFLLLRDQHAKDAWTL